MVRLRPLRSALFCLVPALALLSGCALPLVSESEVEAEARQQFEQMRAKIPISTDTAIRSYVNCVANAVIRELEPPYVDKDWQVEIFDSEDVNAFAMPGGRIGVFTGLLEVAENQDQLAAVIGHEVAHVTQKHALERVNQELTTRAGVIAGAAVIGGPAGTADVLAMGAQLGISLPYGRRQESESDTVGLRYMAAAGFNPRQSIELWKNMGRSSKVGPPEFLSTHPSGENRIKDLIGQLPEALARYNQAQAAGKRPRCQR